MSAQVHADVVGITDPGSSGRAASTKGTTPLTEDHEVTASNERSSVRTFTESEIDVIVSRFERMEQDLIRTARLDREDRRDERNKKKAPERNIEPASSTNKALRTRLQELTTQSIEGRKRT